MVVDFGKAMRGKGARKKEGMGSTYIYIRLFTHSKPLKIPMDSEAIHRYKGVQEKQVDG